MHCWGMHSFLRIQDLFCSLFMESMQVFSSLVQIIYSKVNCLADLSKIQPLQKRIQQGEKKTGLVVKDYTVWLNFYMERRVLLSFK